MTGGTVSISGSLNSEANTTYRVEFFANAANENIGQRFLGLHHGHHAGQQPLYGELLDHLGRLRDRGRVHHGDGHRSQQQPSEFSAAVAASSGMVLWRTKDDTSPNTREWTGSAFNAAGNSSAIGDLVAMQAAEAPTRDEIIVIGRTSGFGPIVGEMWNRPHSWNTLADQSARLVRQRHQLDGRRGLRVGQRRRRDGLGRRDKDLKYSVWNGTSWTAAALQSALATLSGNT